MAIKILYLCGEGRSGSTLLDRILASLDGVTSVGELFELWSHGFNENGRCSCGEPIRSCPFWAHVVEDVTAAHGTPERLLGLQSGVDRTRYFFKISTGIHGRGFARKLSEYKTMTKSLYEAVAKHSTEDVIVDSSKLPTRALILSQIPGITVYLLHLVRDVRGVIYSWSKKKHDPSTGRDMARYAPSRSVAAWTSRNLLTEMLAPHMSYVRVIYEEWARNPRESLQELVDNLEPVAGRRLPFISHDTIELPQIHSVRGNPDRFNQGPTVVRLDDAWKQNLDKRTAQLARTLGAPLLSRYGYFRR